MAKYKELDETNKIKVKEMVFDNNCKIAANGFLGFDVKKLKPSKENLKKFQEQFNGHSLCGCFSCMEIAKTFVVSNVDIKEDVIFESMKDLNTLDFSK
jgi:hypothetical protein